MRAVEMSVPAADASATRVIEAELPEVAAGEVLIEVAYAGINFMDVMARRGDPGYASSYPYRAGLEIAGVVRAVGADVHERALGDRVAAFVAEGGFAEYAVAPAELTVPVPAEVALEQAAAAPLMLATAVLLLEDVVRMRPGESLLMHSASGGLGQALAQVAASLGAELTVGTVGRSDKVEAALAAGWQHALVRGEQLDEQVGALNSRGFDVILDPTGTGNLDFDVAHAAAGGTIVLFGNPGGETLDALPGVGTLLVNNLGVRGFSIRRLRMEAPARVAAALARALELLEAGEVDVAVTIIDDLDGVAAVHDLLAEGRALGKYVVAVNPAL
ncbi:quinone oxidoreductase family protein [Subtercola lobariae]|uniref:Oxidoreductase n=1 Tax=Subtercola lobariae TaxID=1588641 RepID=A0A917EUM5_9MICO|nr:zinc-binding alcohol dehydrogenase family protein [Subtercola lobariae]GGF15995.1 oxidoreductase [Subtercola lobariae]